MPLSTDVPTLRDRVLADLASAHDYYMDTKTVWDMAHILIARGYEINVQNRITGTVTTASGLVAKSRGYIAEQLTEATFQQFISLFENFYFDLLHLWLTAYPQSLGKRMLDFKSILEQPDKESIIELVVRKELNEVLYGRPTEWFSYLGERVKLGCPSENEIERVAEAKASRDVLVHNRGIANKTYESKAGKLARFHEGDRIEIPEDYHRATWELIRKVVSDVSDAVIAKAL